MKLMFKTVLLLISTLMLSLNASAKDYTVQMLNNGADGMFTFQPGYLHINPGDTVTFKAVDAAHDSMSYFIPEGATPWKGGLSQDVTVTFTKEGVYLYKCEPHHALGMLGVIQVGKATNKAAAEKAAQAALAEVVTNKDRLPKLLAQIK